MVVIVCSSCTSNNNSRNGIIQHPTKENLPNPALENEYLIDLNMVEISDSNQKELLSKLENMRRISSNGEGIDNELFGIIIDVEIDYRNRIYILDERRQEVVVFGTAGEYLTTLGGSGKGPGELEYAKSITIYDDKWLLINNSFRIEVYDISGEEISFQETVQFERNTRSICTIGDTLFVHSTGFLDQEQKPEISNFVPVIHAYSLPDFEAIYSFGQSYMSKNPMVIERLSLGSVSCTATTSTVVFSFERFPVLHGYDAKTGELKWKTGIEGLKTTNLEEKNESGRTTISYGPSSNEYRDRLITTINLNNGYEMVQIDRLNLSENSFGSDRDVLTFLINTESGKGQMVSKNLPLVYGVSKDKAVTVSDMFSRATIQDLED